MKKADQFTRLAPPSHSMIKFTFSSLIAFLVLAGSSFAGVYADLEFGDSRKAVLRKLQSSDMVEQTMANELISRTGLNGIFKCKAQLAGLSYHLYFEWTDDGGLNEITLRSNHIQQADYKSSLYNAWKEAAQLFTQVYKTPAQNADFPPQNTLGDSGMMMSHIWHKGEKESILMGTGVDQNNCFLAIRFVNRHVEPARTVTRKLIRKRVTR